MRDSRICGACNGVGDTSPSTVRCECGRHHGRANWGTICECGLIIHPPDDIEPCEECGGEGEVWL